METLSRKDRSERMRQIGRKDTKPEIAVRRLVHGLGYRYRLHVRSLPGKPDLVFKGRRKVIFVHGCFWHRHTGRHPGRNLQPKIAFSAPPKAKHLIPEVDEPHAIAATAEDKRRRHSEESASHERPFC